LTDFRGGHTSRKGLLFGPASRETAERMRNPAMPKTSPLKFLQEVRSETEKVTWPSRRETVITTIMVFVMSAVAALFFLIADQIIRFAITLVLGIGS
jgi:preprotein translocase subunit SecE